MDTERCYGCMRRKTQHPVCEHCGYDERTQNQHNQLPIGTILHGQYEIGKVLGQGGFGITYMGWDTALDMPVAIKEFFPSGLVSRNTELASTVNMTYGSREDIFHQSRERFLREAKILGMLRDIPGIVRVYNLFAENNTAYIIMEFIQGIDLRMYLKKHGVMTVEQTLRILKPVISSLGKLHETNLVHRDISPDNIMMRPDGEAKLLDFGAVSIVANADAEKDLNHSTMAIMKKGFAPMEQYQTRGSLGPWTDVYAMCATIYYCLTGRVPPDAHDRMMDEVSLGWENIPGLTKRQIAALEKGMAIRPKDRIASMQELERELYGTVPQPAPKAAPKQPKPEKKPAPPKPKAEKKPAKKKPIGLMVAALLVVCIVGAVALLWKPSTEEPQLHTPETEAQAVETTQPEETTAETTATIDPNAEAYAEAEALLANGETAKAAIAFGKLGDYKDARERSLELWKQVPYRQTISFWVDDEEKFYFHGLRADGTIAVDIESDDGLLEEALVNHITAEYRDIVSIYGAIGLKYDGTLLVPDSVSYAEELRKWTDIIGLSVYDSKVVAGAETTYVGVKADGTVVAVGSNRYGECDVEGWTNIVTVASGGTHTLGLKADGTVVAAGYNDFNQCNVEEWIDIIDIVAYPSVSFGLKSDGTVVAMGNDYYGTVTKARKLSNVVAIAPPTSLINTIWAVKADGNMSGGWYTQGWWDVVDIATTGNGIATICSDGDLMITGKYSRAREWTDIQIPLMPEEPVGN